MYLRDRRPHTLQWGVSSLNACFIGVFGADYMSLGKL